MPITIDKLLGKALLHKHNVADVSDTSVFYLKLDLTNVPLTGNSLTFEGTAAKDVTVNRHTTADTAGNTLTVQSGGATSGASNKQGGILYLNSGIGTGNNTGSAVILKSNVPTSSGVNDQTLTGRVSVLGTANTRVVIGNGVTNSNTDNQDGISLIGTVAQLIYHKRHTTANTAGNSFTIQAGGATSGATDKNGGSLVLKSGISTGAATSSNILFQTPDSATATGTADNASTTKMTIFSNGQQTSSCTVRNTASGATGIFTYTPTILPLTNSSSEFRALYYQNLVPDTGSVTLNIVTGGNFENRVRTAAQVTATNGLSISGFVVDSSSTATAAVTTVKGIQIQGHSRPSGTTTTTTTYVYGLDATAVLNGTVTATSIYGLNVNNSATGTYTNQYGLYVADQNRATNNFSILTNAGSAVFNEGGDANTDFRIESDTEANMVYLDSNGNTDGTLYVGGNSVTTAHTTRKGGVFFPVQAPTASAPTYVEGGMYYDTTLHKLRVGGAAGWETITSV